MGHRVSKGSGDRYACVVPAAVTRTHRPSACARSDAGRQTPGFARDTRRDAGGRASQTPGGDVEGWVMERGGWGKFGGGWHVVFGVVE